MYAIQVFDSMFCIEDNVYRTSHSFTGTHKIIPILFSLPTIFFKCNLTSLYCIECDEINIRYLDVHKNVSNKNVINCINRSYT